MDELSNNPQKVLQDFRSSSKVKGEWKRRISIIPNKLGIMILFIEEKHHID
jgi:hypothetical protein